jgi:ABC-type glycerol-3-phosphate transport system permease component
MSDSLSAAASTIPAGTRRPRALWLVYVPLILLLIFAVAPLLLAWFTAFKTDQQQLANPYGLPVPPTLDNLREAWTVGRFSIYFKNSVVISIVDVIGMVIVSSLAGYAFARLQFP